MENIPNNDFEVVFYSGGKVLKMEANDNVVKIIDPNGKSIDVNEETEKHLTPSRQQMLQHFHQVYDHCRALETALEQLSTGTFQCFPAVIGKKPNICGVFKGKENTSTSPCMPMLGSFEVSDSAVNPRRPVSRTGSSSRSSRTKTRTMDIPHVGVASQKPNGELKITYQDGTELRFDEVAGIAYNDGRKVTKYRHTEVEWLPDTIKVKVSQIPTVLRCFMGSQACKASSIR